MICKGCKHFFTSGNRPDGLPNGCGFQLDNGKIINLCADCLIRLGQMDDEQKREFIDQLKGKTEG